MKFDEIKTPNDLIKYMSNNIKYGFVTFDNQKFYDPASDEWNDYWYNSGIVQDGEALLKTNCGTCWDQVELERKWFFENNYKFKTYYMFFEIEDKPLPTHTFLVYEMNNKYYWFENSFEKYRGIHKYNSIDELLHDVLEKQFDYAYKNRGACIEDKDQMRVFEYSKPEKNIKVSEYLQFMFDIYYGKQK